MPSMLTLSGLCNSLTLCYACAVFALCCISTWLYLDFAVFGLYLHSTVFVIHCMCTLLYLHSAVFGLCCAPLYLDFAGRGNLKSELREIICVPPPGSDSWRFAQFLPSKLFSLLPSFFPFFLWKREDQLKINCSTCHLVPQWKLNVGANLLRLHLLFKSICVLSVCRQRVRIPSSGDPTPQLKFAMKLHLGQTASWIRPKLH